jgi:hypothetical protein
LDWAVFEQDAVSQNMGSCGDPPKPFFGESATNTHDNIADNVTERLPAVGTCLLKWMLKVQFRSQTFSQSVFKGTK